MKKKIPTLPTDDAAGRFVEGADLTDFDLSGFRPATFEFDPKTARVNMRLPERLLDAVKARARERGIPYQRLIREALEHEVERP